ncbi:sugar transferase [Flavobacterium sp. 83]|jgi:lipopolysaccharide/colanic/teichoic acid biosynthesis glycosyltransferase|uniref:sugar transferase n=1 Tax=Flavobacterium sp. 83 TaxID=1131812 RepID=UPI00054E31C5|nr:sugar transferase [Flavobacterium sp. 83]
MAKRFFDSIIAIFILLLFLWMILFAWLLAVIDTKTNGIFVQERIGQYGEIFKIYKLRTIPIDTSTGGSISKIGRMLRKYKLDELPQLFNVLKGEMSLVGPRPDLPGYYDLLEGENRKLLELKPGLTCLASLKYSNEESILIQQEFPLLYNDQIIFPDKVQLNLDYYYCRSFFGDVAIIVKTAWFIFFRKG